MSLERGAESGLRYSVATQVAVPPESMRVFSQAKCGGGLEFRDVSWPHRQSTVWEVEQAGRTVAFLKMHSQSRKFESELRNYREYVPVLGRAAPQLMGVYEEAEHALLISVLPGRVASLTEWSAETEYELHVRASGLLRLLHQIPVEEAQRREVEARTRASLNRWFERARAHLPANVMNWAIERIEGGIAQSPPICVCHKDFSPRNWIATPDGQVGLIDFERTCVDYQYLDWSRLWMREWLRRPELKDAFFTGYGVVPELWEDLMQRFLTLDAVAGVAWAIEHNDLRFAEENRAIVERLRRESKDS